MKALYTVRAIKNAVDSGDTVKCDGGGYTVIKDSIGQYLIKHVSGHCVGLHGAAGTKYAYVLNGSRFYTGE